MTRLRTRIALCAFFLVILGGAATPFIARWHERREVEELLQHPLPEAGEPLTEGNRTILPEVNLPVPFVVQAPLGNWDLPYQEACEEAAALMAIRYAFATPFLDTEDADTALRELVRINEEVLQYPIDQTAEQVARLMVTVDSLMRVSLVRSPTLESLKRHLSAGRVIIVPAAGQKLRNPFFHRPGPRYHMLVLRGYTSDGYFITNDPGTKRGENYLYPFDRIMQAMGDWNNGNPEEGEKVALVVEPLSEEERKIQRR